jgi:hypothetical protein
MYLPNGRDNVRGTKNLNNPIIHLKLDNIGYSSLSTHEKTVLPHLVVRF